MVPETVLGSFALPGFAIEAPAATVQLELALAR